MVVADVAGKGMASAIMSTSFRSALPRHGGRRNALGDLATRMNQHHGRRAKRRARHIDGHLPAPCTRKPGELEVVNAGHNPGFFLQPPARSRDCLRLRARRWACCQACAT